MTVSLSQGLLDVGAGHHVYFEEYGQADAPAAVVLHGGPGSSCNTGMLDWFDLSRQRVVLFDQRGCGKSTPAGALAHNTTRDLIEDIERLRRSLQIAQWLVVGGSWGAMLGLAYAAAYPASLRGLVLRGVFLPGPEQLDWFFQSLRALVPEAWAALTTTMSQAEQNCVLSSLAHRLLHGTDDEQCAAAGKWSQYEDAIMAAMMGKSQDPAVNRHSRQLHKYRLQAHYLSHGCFVTEAQLLQGAQSITTPTIFVHGTHDWICPPQNLVRLMPFMPHAQIRWVARGTHTPSDPAIQAELRAAIRDVTTGASLETAPHSCQAPQAQGA